MAERIWIMGASDGIGAALARGYAARGAELILSARRGAALQKLADEIGGAQIVPVDITDIPALTEAAQLITKSGPLDRALTLAAIYEPGKALDADPAQAARIVSVNLTGTLNFAQAAAPLLRTKGQLVLTGSVAGYVGLPQGQIYSATKAAVLNLAESLRVELAPQYDVRLISPGFVATNMTAKNSFDMPFIIPPNRAADKIIRGLDGKRFEIHFPKRLTLGLKLLRALPYWAALPLTKRLVQ